MATSGLPAASRRPPGSRYYRHPFIGIAPTPAKLLILAPSFRVTVRKLTSSRASSRRRRPRDRIGARLPDRRQHLRRHPFLEPLRRRLPAGQHRAVEAGFVGNGHFLRPARGRNSSPPLFVVVQPISRLVWRTDAQHGADVRQDEPRLPAAVDDAHRQSRENRCRKAKTPPEGGVLPVLHGFQGDPPTALSGVPLPPPPREEDRPAEAAEMMGRLLVPFQGPPSGRVPDHDAARGDNLPLTRGSPQVRPPNTHGLPAIDRRPSHGAGDGCCLISTVAM